MDEVEPGGLARGGGGVVAGVDDRPVLLEPFDVNVLDGGAPLGGALSEVAHVDVTAAAVEEEATVAGRLIPIAVVEVDEAIAVVLEEPIADAGEYVLNLRRGLHQAPVFCFQACDALGH